MKASPVIAFLLQLLLLLLGFTSARAAAASSSTDPWSFELSNQSGDRATLNKVWCAAAASGDLAFGPVQGADTSAPDASIWGATQPTDMFLLRLLLPALDYSCLLQVQGFSQPLWSFSLPLATLSQDGWPSGSIQCNTPWHYTGAHPEDIPPLCQLFGDDGYAIASVKVSSLSPEDPSTKTPLAGAPAPSPSDPPASNAAAPAPISAFDQVRASASMSAAPSPSYADSNGDRSNSSAQAPASPTNTHSPPTTAPAPISRKLLAGLHH